jgi:hypothetical protein
MNENLTVIWKGQKIAPKNDRLFDCLTVNRSIFERPFSQVRYGVFYVTCHPKIMNSRSLARQALFLTENPQILTVLNDVHYLEWMFCTKKACRLSRERDKRRHSILNDN